MSKKTFSDKEIELLSNNKYVLNVSEKVITYTNEFKIHFISEYSKSKTSRVIFEEAGFNVDIIGIRRIDCAGNRWRKAFREQGVLGLDDTRRNNSGRPRERELTQKEIISKKDAEIEYLKAEIELLKKLELHERQVKKDRLIAAQAFKLIESIVTNFNQTSIVTYLCSTAGVSRSGYYNYLKSKDLRQQRHDKDLLVKNNILKAFNYKGYNKGSRSIKMTLENKFNIICPIRKTNLYKRIAKATKEHSVVPNLLNRNFKQGVPGKVLKSYGLGKSMSRRGNCWDNAPQESFFGHMKDEVDYRNYSSLSELESAINSYVHYYNYYRYQWNLKKLTPVQYRNQLLIA